MRCLTNALVLILAISVSPMALAEYQRYGAGLHSCGSWLKERKDNNWYTMGQWVLGYVTAYGYYGEQELKNVDSFAMAAWIDNYCQLYPLEDIEKASQKLIEELSVNR